MNNDQGGGPGKPPEAVAAGPGGGIGPNTPYRTLGNKTFALFIFERCQAALVLLLLSIALFIVQAQPFVAQIPVPQLNRYLILAAWGLLALFIVFALLAFLVSWLIYKNYQFSLDEDALKIKRGVLEKEEISIPYRQIQDVDIDRSLAFQMVGLSRIIILTAGHEDEKPSTESGESEGVLPALDKDLAEWLREELLKRANVQKIRTE